MDIEQYGWGKRLLIKRWKLHLGLVLLLLIGILINAADGIKPEPLTADARQHVTMAYNTFKYGVISDEIVDTPDVAPTYRREPLYPIMLAGVLHTIRTPDSLSLQCLVDAEPACHGVLIGLQWFNIGLLLAASLATFLAAQIIVGHIGGSYLASILVGISPSIGAVKSFYSELPAALALLIFSTFLYLRLTHRKAWPLAMGAGLAFGALMLIKAVFFYLGVVLGVGFAIAAGWHRSWQPLKMAIIVLLSAYAIAGIWMTRNYIQFGDAAISGRSGEILAIRAEFSKMTWQEYRASFLAYTPEHGKSLLKRFFKPEDYQHFDRANPEGFYRRTKNRVAALRTNGGDYSKLEEQLATESKAIIKRNWIKHLALTATFAYRGAYIKIVPENSLVPTRLLYILSGAIVLYFAVRWQDGAMFMFLLPSFYSYGIHAVATHYIPRYSEPLIPCLAIAFVFVVVRIGYWVRQTIGLAKMRSRSR
jgi:4-amino-4-deoxy-L-arabinose transferase-like glycosyltransferase